MSGSTGVMVSASTLRKILSDIFTAAGIRRQAAKTVAEGLVQADLEGLNSHGVMLADMYVERIRQGSVSSREHGSIVSDNGIAIVMDAGHALGQLTGEQATLLAISRAKELGAGIVSVRHAFHFGTARRYALMAAENNCVGIVMCNTRPLMPAPGGANRVVGNNPVAIAIPTIGPEPIVLDMATSEAAMGKIRMAANSNQSIPETWAVKEDGSPTTDPNEAILGMLLPSAGPKGFGLSFVIDLMCGLLSGGAFGNAVRPLYGDPSEPYDCSHLFIAINIEHFGDPLNFRRLANDAATKLRNGKRAAGTSRLYTPGEPEWERQQSSNGQVKLSKAVSENICNLAKQYSVQCDLQDT